jgi:hypothetical protein
MNYAKEWIYWLLGNDTRNTNSTTQSNPTNQFNPFFTISDLINTNKLDLLAQSIIDQVARQQTRVDCPGCLYIQLVDFLSTELPMVEELYYIQNKLDTFNIHIRLFDKNQLQVWFDKGQAIMSSAELLYAGRLCNKFEDQVQWCKDRERLQNKT